MIKACISCGAVFETDIGRKVSCSRACSQKWRRDNVYGDKYTIKHRGATPRNFLLSLSKKKGERRNLSIEFLLNLYNKQQGLCAISGVKMTHLTGNGRVPTNISIDRIDSNKGYDEDNVQLVCRQVNIMKSELSLEELKSWCSNILNN